MALCMYVQIITLVPSRIDRRRHYYIHTSYIPPLSPFIFRLRSNRRRMACLPCTRRTWTEFWSGFLIVGKFIYLVPYLHADTLTLLPSRDLTTVPVPYLPKLFSVFWTLFCLPPSPSPSPFPSPLLGFSGRILNAQPYANCHQIVFI